VPWSLLAALLTLQESIYSRCLMIPSDSLVNVWLPDSTSLRESFVHETGATERVSIYCLGSEVSS
jgi:hypothetical protein